MTMDADDETMTEIRNMIENTDQSLDELAKIIENNDDSGLVESFNDSDQEKEASKTASSNLISLNECIKDAMDETDSRPNAELKQYQEMLAGFEQRYRKLSIKQFARSTSRKRLTLLYDATDGADTTPINDDEFWESLSMTPESITSNFEEISRDLSDTVASNISSLSELESSSQWLDDSMDEQHSELDSSMDKSKSLISEYGRRETVQKLMFNILVAIFFMEREPPEKPNHMLTTKRSIAERLGIQTPSINKKPSSIVDVFTKTRTQSNHKENAAKIFRSIFPGIGELDLAGRMSKLSTCTAKCSMMDEEKTISSQNRTFANWMFESTSRADAEMLLNEAKTGTFLIRSSEHFPGNFTLSLKSNDGVEHYRILFDGTGYSIDNEGIFKSLDELVEHYLLDADGLCCRLGSAAIKNTGLGISPTAIESFLSNGCQLIESRSINVLELIGEGEYARAYKAKLNGNKVAIKVLKDIVHIDSFNLEASIVQKLKNPFLIEVFGISVIPTQHFSDVSQLQPSFNQQPNKSACGKSYCIVMEYMPRGNLHEYLMSRGRTVISISDLVRFLTHIAQALVYLESQTIAHCDIAANNILLADDLTAKLSDFGLAVRYDKANLSQFIPDQSPKQSDQKRHKIRIKWAAPECLQHEANHTNKSDVWSFGVLIWEVFQFGRTPYPRIRNAQMLSYLTNGKRMDPPDNCPAPIQKLMKQCWATQPNLRPTSTEVLQILLKYDACTKNQ